MASSYEVAWAKWFDENNIEYQYEPEKIAFKRRNHIPDFWLPKLKTYFEVKGVIDEKDIENKEDMVKLCKKNNWHYMMGFEETGKAYLIDENMAEYSVKMDYKSFTVLAKGTHTKKYMAKKHFIPYKNITPEDGLFSLYVLTADIPDNTLPEKIEKFVRKHKELLTREYGHIFAFIFNVNRKEKEDGFKVSVWNVWEAAFYAIHWESKIKFIEPIIQGSFVAQEDCRSGWKPGFKKEEHFSVFEELKKAFLKRKKDLFVQDLKSDFDFKSVLLDEVRKEMFENILV